MRAPPDWPPLSESALAALRRAARLLSEGMSGEIRIVSRDGGVREFVTTASVSGDRLQREERLRA